MNNNEYITFWQERSASRHKISVIARNAGENEYAIKCQQAAAQFYSYASAIRAVTCHSD